MCTGQGGSGQELNPRSFSEPARFGSFLSGQKQHWSKRSAGASPRSTESCAFLLKSEELVDVCADRGVLLADLVPLALTCTVRHAGTASPVMNCAKSSKKRPRLSEPKFRGVAGPGSTYRR